MDSLIDGLNNSFNIGVTDPPRECYKCKNLQSALRASEFVATAIKGYMIGQVSDPPFDNNRVSPLGVAVGKYSGKKHLILDISSPLEHEHVQSVNSCIDKK